MLLSEDYRTALTQLHGAMLNQQLALKRFGRNSAEFHQATQRAAELQGRLKTVHRVRLAVAAWRDPVTDP